jgi:hypothetical protein
MRKSGLRGACALARICGSFDAKRLLAGRASGRRTFLPMFRNFQGS